MLPPCLPCKEKSLTRWDLNKMEIFKWIFLNEKYCIWMKNFTVLFKCTSSNKPFPEPLISKPNNTFMSWLSSGLNELSGLEWGHQLSQQLDLRMYFFNSLAPGRFQFNFRKVLFKLTLVNGGCGIFYEIALRWMPQDLTNDKSTLVQVMAWCRQATSHYLTQCWPRSMSPNGVTRSQWVNLWFLQSRLPGYIVFYIHLLDSTTNISHRI